MSNACMYFVFRMEYPASRILKLIRAVETIVRPLIVEGSIKLSVLFRLDGVCIILTLSGANTLLG